MDDQNLTSDELRLLKIVNLGIEQVVIPAMDHLESELVGEIAKTNNKLDQVKRILDNNLAQTIDLRHRVQTIESLPVISSQLVSKKS